ncbi:MAG: 5'-methylthioadenosine/adenosylhomocysteine nucleosidase [Fusobacteriales bacterium]|jgi:adenosylhomocysteine nucleosidase|nr:5'-methylthioadenosine/adenosylhomocysteine nucleosidase [Fusobacteriales bacterium]
MVGIIGAMSEEVNIIKDEMQFSHEEIIGKFIFYIGSLRNRKIVLAESGIGKVNAAMLATIMIVKFNVKAVCFSGVAGALDSRLKVGDVVIGEKMLQHDMDVKEFGLKKGEIPRMDTSVFLSNDRLMAIVKEYKLSNNKIYSGTIISGDQFISLKQTKQELASEFNAMCVDMESAAVAQVCHRLDKKCLVIRSISDSVTDDSMMEYSQFTELAANNSKELVCRLTEVLSQEQI